MDHWINLGGMDNTFGKLRELIFTVFGCKILSKNDIGKIGVMSLRATLLQNTALTSLDLSGSKS